MLGIYGIAIPLAPIWWSVRSGERILHTSLMITIKGSKVRRRPNLEFSMINSCKVLY